MTVRDTVRDESGFSTVELLWAAFIGLLVLGVAYMVMDTGMKAFSQIEGQTQSSRTAAGCMMRMQRPIREATRITTATEYDFEFLSDPDDDGYLERVRFYIPAATTELRQDTTDASGTVTRTVADTVRNRTVGEPMFTYYESDATTLTGANRTKAALVRVLVIVQPDTIKPTPQYRVLTDIGLRNHRED